MITVSLYRPDRKKTPHEILQLLRLRGGDLRDDPWMKYAEWLFENNIEATIPATGDINFLHDEDALAFRLKFEL